MNNFFDFLNQFQGIATLFSSNISVSITRIFLIILGLFLMYLGKKGILEALLMVPMGLGMATINASVMFLPAGIPGGFAENGSVQGTLFLDSMVTDVQQVFDLLQIDFLQPVYGNRVSTGHWLSFATSFFKHGTCFMCRVGNIYNFANCTTDGLNGKRSCFYCYGRRS